MAKRIGKKSIHWYAGSDDILRMGPFGTEVAAWQALKVVTQPSAASISACVDQLLQANARGLRQNSRVTEVRFRIHLPGAYVWPEEVA